MNTTIQYYLSLSSPYTYMGHTRLGELASRHGLDVVYRPMNMGKVFPVSGGLPLAKRSPQRQAYRMMELKRWHEFLNIPLNLEPKYFPVSEALASKAVIAAMLEQTNPAQLIFGFLRAVWAEERDISDSETVAAILRENGYEAEKILALAEGAAVQEAADSYTQEAIDVGVFGAPTYRLGEELFWGQDRLDLLEHTISAHAGKKA